MPSGGDCFVHTLDTIHSGHSAMTSCRYQISLTGDGGRKERTSGMSNVHTERHTERKKEKRGALYTARAPHEVSTGLLNSQLVSM